MSPILVRPVREQLEHDRIIRLLQTKFRRKYQASESTSAPSRPRRWARGPPPSFPTWCSPPRSAGGASRRWLRSKPASRSTTWRRWPSGRTCPSSARPFICTSPAGMVDVARRLAEENQVHVQEIWSYHTIGDQVRFTLVHRNREAAPAPRPAAKAAPAPRPAAKARPAAPRPAAPRRAPARAPAARRKPAARRAKSPARSAGAKKTARSQKRK